MSTSIAGTTIPAGEIVELTVAFENSTGGDIEPSDVDLFILQPLPPPAEGWTEEEPTPTLVEEGIWKYQFEPRTAGVWWWRWEGVGVASTKWQWFAVEEAPLTNP